MADKFQHTLDSVMYNKKIISVLEYWAAIINAAHVHKWI